MKAEFRTVYNPERVALHEVLPLETPYAISICPSQACNIKCKYCLHSLDQQALERLGFPQVKMNMETLDKVLIQLKEFPQKIKSISVSGQGESLCNSAFAQMVTKIKQADVAEDVSFITNGLLLTQQLAQEIIDAGLDRIFISIQGTTAKKYEEICGAKVDMEKFVKILTCLYQYSRGKCQINIKIADISLEDDLDRERFLNMFGSICDNIHIETIKPLYANVDYSNILGNHTEQEVTVSRFGRVHPKQQACYLSFYMLTIDPMGEIHPCGAPFNPCKALGNIHDTTLLQAWNSPARKAFLLDMLQGKRFESDVCKDCDYPNDVPTENDEIDPWREELMQKYQ